MMKRVDVPGSLDLILGDLVRWRRAALEQIGPSYKTTLFMYGDDADLAFCMRKADLQLAVADDSRVWHKQSASLGRRSPVLDAYFTCSEVRFLRRYAPIPFISISLMLGMRLAKRLVTGGISRARAVLKGFLDA